MLPRLLILPVFGLLALISPTAAAGAASERAEVEVRSVESAVLRHQAGWHETTIEIAVTPRAGSEHYVDRIGVTLRFAYEPAGRAGKLRFFQARVEAVSVPSGRASVRFYLPPEVVARDRLTGRLEHYSVEIAVAGRVQPASAAASSDSLRTPERLKAFLERVAIEALATDGVLLPQFLTPFAWDRQKPAPSLVRPSASGMRE